jgi:hypothetical protein
VYYQKWGIIFVLYWRNKNVRMIYVVKKCGRYIIIYVKWVGVSTVLALVITFFLNFITGVSYNDKVK